MPIRFFIKQWLMPPGVLFLLLLLAWWLRVRRPGLAAVCFALGLGGQVFASVGQACALTGLQQGVAALQHVAFFVQPGQVVLVQAQQHVVAHHLSLQQGFGTVGGGGSGIGLAIVKSIVSAHHGSVAAQSDLRSTRFIVVLPKQA